MRKTSGPITSTLIYAVVAATSAIAQTPKLPEQQARFCSILSSWRYHRGNPLGHSAPTAPANPIQAAKAPTSAPRADMFDQLVDLMGPSGQFNGWKGTVSFNVTTDKKVWLQMGVTCPDMTDIRFPIYEGMRHAALPSLDSPIATFLGTVRPGAHITFTGHLMYNEKARFYETDHGPNARTAFSSPPYGPLDMFFGVGSQVGSSLIAVFTDVGR